MKKYKIVHYINQFFAGIGGEEKADYKPELREGNVGPGLALDTALGDDYEVVATIICGDNYFGENLETATDTVLEMVKNIILMYLLPDRHLMQGVMELPVELYVKL